MLHLCLPFIKTNHCPEKNNCLNYTELDIRSSPLLLYKIQNNWIRLSLSLSNNMGLMEYRAQGITQTGASVSAFACVATCK